MYHKINYIEVKEMTGMKRILLIAAAAGGFALLLGCSASSAAETASSKELNLNTDTSQSKEQHTEESSTTASSILASESSSSDTPDSDPATMATTEETRQEISATPYAASLPQDPTIIPIDKVFQAPIGNSTSILEDGKLLQLNPATASQKGAIWSKRPISLLSDFTFKSYLYLGNQQGNAGDGMTFTLTNDPRMTNDPTQVIGSSGMGIGAYSTRSGEPYVQNGLSIEFDTYKNQGSADRMDREISGDTNGRGHIAFVTPKANNNNYTNEHAGVTIASTYLSNDTWRMLTVRWEANARRLTYELDGVGTSSYVVNDLNAQFGATSVYWGFTSSTGGKYQENALAMTQIPSSVQSTAEISVNGGAFVTAVEASKSDQLTFKNTLNIDNDLVGSKVSQPQVSLTLPTEISYEKGSLSIDGVQVAEADITIAGSRLTLDLSNYLILEKDMLIELKATLQDGTPEKVLPMNFEYLEEATLLQKSNEVSVKIAKPKEKTLSVFYKEEATNLDIAQPKQITGTIGDAYKETPEDIAGFVFKTDSGNAEGTFSDSSQDIYFYYRTGELYFLEAPNQIAFGTQKVSNNVLKLFGRPTEGLKIMDERASNGWRVELKQTQAFSDGKTVMPDILSFVTDSTSETISDAAITLFESNKKGETDLSGLLDDTSQRGIRAEIPVEYQRIGSFKGTLSWTLANVPDN